MNEAYTTDFIARCIAAEALEKAESGSSDVADVDASVSNSQLTIQLEDSNGSPVGSGATVNLPSGLPPSTSSDEGKVLTVNSSGNAEWDESKVNVFRTAYRSVLDDYTSSYDASGNWVLTFEPEVSFEKLDVYLQWHFDWSAGTDWPLRTSTRSIMLSLTKDVAGPVVSPGMNVYLANSVNQTDNPNSNLLYDVLLGSINVNYDAQTNTVTMLVAKPIMDAVSDPGLEKNNLPVVMTNCVANAFGYVAYGSDDYVVYEGLQAGSGIDITNDVISADLDVDASVSGNQLTIQLENGSGTPIGSGSTVNLPNGLPASTSADEGKVLTVNASGNAEWDESEATILRTAYVPLAATDYVKTKINDNKYNVVFDAPVGFELLEARISYSITFTCGAWVDATLTFTDTLSIPSSVGSTPREGRKIYTQKLADHYSSDATPVHYNQMVDEVTGANWIQYDEQTGKITLEIGNLTCPYVEYTTGAVDNTTLVISDLTITSLGYVAYGADNVNITTGIIGGTGIDVDGNVISLDANYGASFELSINSSTYVLTATLKDQNGNTLGTPQTVDLPLETMIVSGSYDDTTKKIVLTLQNGNTVEFSVADLVSGLETSTHAAQTYQTIAGMSNYATQNDISDMATQTWVGQQGYLTSADEVPDVTSSDDGKVLKATYSGGTGSYAWATAPSGLPASTSSEEGLALTVDSNGDPLWGSVGWDAIGNAIVPPATDPNVNDGDVLTYNSTTGMAMFQAPSGGSGLQVETDGTNYWITVNGIRLYFASSAPTGTIPDGSIGIGW